MLAYYHSAISNSSYSIYEKDLLCRVVASKLALQFPLIFKPKLDCAREVSLYQSLPQVSPPNIVGEIRRTEGALVLSTLRRYNRMKMVAVTTIGLSQPCSSVAPYQRESDTHFTESSSLQIGPLDESTRLSELRLTMIQLVSSHTARRLRSTEHEFLKKRKKAERSLRTFLCTILDHGRTRSACDKSAHHQQPPWTKMVSALFAPRLYCTFFVRSDTFFQNHPHETCLFAACAGSKL